MIKEIMKCISLIPFMRLTLFLVILLTNVKADEAWSIKNLPFNSANLQSERGDRIWKYDFKNQTFKKLAFVWNFITLVKNCEGISEKDIYFATNLEYYLGGGTKIDNPQIRIFSLDDSSPWRDSDLGIVPNIDWAKQFCEFY